MNLIPDRPLPEEALPIRISHGADVTDESVDEDDDQMGRIDSEDSALGGSFSLFGNSELESDDNMSMASDEGFDH